MKKRAAPVAAPREAVLLQRACSTCSEEEELHRDADPGLSPSPATKSVNSVVSSSGQALPAAVRERVETRLAHSFGGMRVSAANVSQLPSRYRLSQRDDPSERHAEQIAAGPRVAAATTSSKPDLSPVRVHTGADAAAAARSVAARAFTLGNHVVFGEGQFAPNTPAGEQLLVHELSHVLQTEGQIGQSLHRDEKKEVQLPQQMYGCDGRSDLTVDFARFVRDRHKIIAGMKDVNDVERTGITKMADFVLTPEGGVDLNKFKVIGCDKITSVLLGAAGQALAEIDTGANEVRLGKTAAGILIRLVEPDMTVSKEEFVNLLQTLAHERRHVTLGNLMNVDPKNARENLGTMGPQLVRYRAEEILAVVEEQAVGRMALGASFEVEPEIQMHLHRQRNMIVNFSSEAEWNRLRAIILDQLRTRYGRNGKCDTSLTIGVMRSLDRGSWYWCSSGRIIGDIPPGVVACEEDGKHRVCGKPS
ncbi:MAG TPA: DUF4157 domain-containing protein [Steroidobacteraceae bacterium]|jgi:hypothetical protein|nr:DUF4157 domain-containing protein [Steroidobacteraceae bacterium]